MTIATVLEIPKLLLFHMKQDQESTVIMSKSIAVKALLSEMHKMQRVMFATSKLSEPNNHFWVQTYKVYRAISWIVKCSWSQRLNLLQQDVNNKRVRSDVLDLHMILCITVNIVYASMW